MAIGYVGVGNMGGAIASAMAAAHEVLVFDPSPEAVAACVAAGATACDRLEDLARRCETIFLCLPTFAHVERVLDAASGLVAAAAPGTLLVDQSTSHPLRFLDLAAALAARGLELVDAPVSGGPQGVQRRSLMVTVGGTEAQFARIASILAAVTDVILHTGPVGTAMATKVANNYLAATQAAVTLQVMALAITLGCDPATTAEALRLGSGNNYYVNRFLASHVLTGELGSGATIEVMQKDVALACEIAERAGAPLVGQEDLPALIDACVRTYGKDASYNALALTVSDAAMVAIGGTRGARLGEA